MESGQSGGWQSDEKHAPSSGILQPTVWLQFEFRFSPSQVIFLFCANVLFQILQISVWDKDSTWDLEPTVGRPQAGNTSCKTQGLVPSASTRQTL